MNTYKFKTNLNCSNCVQAVKPLLDSIKEIDYWEVNLENSDKLLEIEASIDVSEIVSLAIKKAGFEINRLEV